LPGEAGQEKTRPEARTNLYPAVLIDGVMLSLLGRKRVLESQVKLVDGVFSKVENGKWIASLRTRPFPVPGIF
jgi:hypothetical protein